MTAFLVANLAPIMFGSLIVFLLFGYPVAFSLAACGLFFGFVGIELGTINPAFLQSLPLRMFGIMQNDTLLAIPVLHLHGADPGTIRHGRGLARHHRPAVRPDPRRPGLRGDSGGRHAGRHHRRRGRFGDLDGPDLAAHHAALRL
jgi:hypothetical protein